MSAISICNYLEETVSNVLKTIVSASMAGSLFIGSASSSEAQNLYGGGPSAGLHRPYGGGHGGGLHRSYGGGHGGGSREASYWERHRHWHALWPPFPMYPSYPPVHAPHGGGDDIIGDLG